MDLKEWSVQYVKHRDIIHKSLTGHEETKHGILFSHTDKTHNYFIVTLLTKEVLERESKANQVTIVCAATKENFKTLVDNWKSLEKRQKLTIIFVNLEKNDKWIIRPWVHAKVADPESLETGLQSMFEQVSE